MRTLCGFIGAIAGLILSSTFVALIGVISDQRHTGLISGADVALPIGGVLGAILGVPIALRIHSQRDPKNRADESVQPVRLRRRVLRGVAIAGALVFTETCLIQACEFFSGPPPDWEMIAYFHLHRSEFERRLTTRISNDNLPGHGTNIFIEFPYWRDGGMVFFQDSEFKNIVYINWPPEPLLPSLDTVRPGYSETFRAYRQITGNWYLYYGHDPG